MSDVQPAAVAAETAPVESTGQAVESLDTGSGLVEEQADAIDQAAASGEITKKEAQSLKKQLKIKIDGVEETIDLDMSNDEELKRHIQKGRAFDKRAKEYASLKNTVEGFIQQLTSGDESAEKALAQLGMNPEEFAVKLMERKIKELEKSPEQVEREKMQKELEELRNEKKRAEEEKQQMQMEKLRNQYAAEIENEIESGLNDAKSKLPKGNPRVIKRIAQTMLHAMENGYNDVTVRDVIPVVEKEWQEELRSYFDTSAEDLLEELVGKHNLDRVRKKRLGSRPNAPKTSASSIKDTGSSKIQEDVERPKKSLKSFLRDD